MSDKRPWFKVTVDFVRNPKVLALTHATRWALLELWAHCMEYDTDGFVDASTMNRIAKKVPRAALIDAGFVIDHGARPGPDLRQPGAELAPARRQEDVRKRYEMRDYLSHQSSSAERAVKREQRSSAGKKSAEARQTSRQRAVDPPVDDSVEREVNRGRGRERKELLSEVESASQAPAAREETAGPKVPIRGWKLVREHTSGDLGSVVQSGLSIEADAMLHAGTPEADVAACLRIWDADPKAGVRLLPHLLAQAVKERINPTATAAGPATTKATGWIEAGHQAAATYTDQKAIAP